MQIWGQNQVFFEAHHDYDLFVDLSFPSIQKIYNTANTIQILREFLQVLMALGILIYFFTESILVSLIELNWLSFIKAPKVN